ncbi:MAG: hypothetical protein KAX39_05250 [candidate division Zixibacteria bacterium]|nr:hypothetical protein [candidate division Zixibacteria bacterium]
MCLDKKYSPFSHIPCVDFSPRLLSRIVEKDYKAIGVFLWQILDADAEFVRNYWENIAIQFLTMPLNRNLAHGTGQAYTELRCALILISLHNDFNDFILSTDAPRYLSTVMLPHLFDPEGIGELIERANSFILRMRKDAPFWKEFPLFTSEQFSDIKPPKDPQLLNFQQKLRELPLGTRAHFFDILQYFRFGNKPKRRPLEEMTFYDTRKRGLDAHESAEKLVESGLVIRVNDLYGFLLTKTKNEIISVLSAMKIDCRKSWKKARLIELALDECRDKIVEMSRQAIFADVVSEYKDSGWLGIEYIERMTPFYQVWLGFGLKIGNEY